MAAFTHQLREKACVGKSDSQTAHVKSGSVVKPLVKQPSRYSSVQGGFYKSSGHSGAKSSAIVMCDTCDRDGLWDSFGSVKVFTP